jgi:hypothetical protein
MTRTYEELPPQESWTDDMRADLAKLRAQGGLAGIEKVRLILGRLNRGEYDLNKP